MRQQFLSSEESTTPIPVATRVASEQTAPVSITTPFRKKTKDRTRMLRMLILVTASLGVMSLLLSLPGGGSSVNYVRGTVALKLGSLSGATEAFLVLPGDSIEADVFSDQLFPRLLAAKDYERAAQVCGHLWKGGGRSLATRYANQLWDHLTSVEGWEKAMAIRTQASGLWEVRPVMPILNLTGLPANTPVDYALLDRYLPKLLRAEKQALAEDLARHHLKRKNLAEAWRWTVMLPEESIRGSLVHLMTHRNPELALRFLSTLDSSPNSDRMRTDALWAIVPYAPKLAPRLLKTIKDPDMLEEAHRLLPPTPIRITPTR